MPLKQRLPKFGFTSRKSLVSGEVRLNEIAKVEGDIVTLETLKQAGLLTNTTKFAKVVLSGEISRSVTVQGLGVTKGARAAIEAAGGKIEE
jgi:large subunit ribosomal protein L15